jgi:hypothetical protein
MRRPQKFQERFERELGEQRRTIDEKLEDFKEQEVVRERAG